MNKTTTFREDLKKVGFGLCVAVGFALLVLLTVAASSMKVSDFPKATNAFPTDKILLALSGTNKYIEFVDLAAQLKYTIDTNGSVVAVSNLPLLEILGHLFVGSNVYAGGQLYIGGSNYANSLEVVGTSSVPVFVVGPDGTVYGNGAGLSNTAGGLAIVTNTDGSVTVDKTVSGTTNTFTLSVSGYSLLNATSNGYAIYTNSEGQIILSNTGPAFSYLQPTNWGIQAYTQGNSVLFSNSGPWYGSNIFVYSDSWAGPTNLIKAWLLNRDYIANTPTAITDITDVVTDRIYTPTMVQSNASGSNITLYLTAPGLRFLGTSTNALDIPSTKMGMTTFHIRGGRWTNVVSTTVSQ